MRATRIALAFSVFGLLAVGACTSEVNPLIPEIDGGVPPGFDGSLPPFDAAGVDTGSFCPPGATVSPTGLCQVPDSSVPDAGEAPDSSQPDTNAPDTSEPDTSVVDTGADVTEDTTDSALVEDTGPDVFDAGVDAFDGGPDVFDAGVDAFDAGPDVFDSGPDVFDAGVDVFDAGPPPCVVGLYGNYYTRTDGTVVHAPTKTVIVIDSTSQRLAGVTQVFDNVYSACALRAADQTVWCWPTFDPAPGFGGNNTGGQLGNGTFTEVTDSSKFYRATQVEVSHPDGGAPVYLDNVTSITSGSEGGYVTATCAIRSDKSLWCWGPATQGHLWQGTLGTTADLAFATPIKMDADAGAFITNVDQVSVGNRHTCFLSAGQVYCWGNNTSGELGTGDSTDQPYPFHVTTNLPATVDMVAAEEDQTCVLASQHVYCWGADTYTSEGNPNVPPGICNSNFCEPLPVEVQAALPDGGVSQTPLANVSTLFVGYQFACTLDPIGNISCWGQWSGTPVIYKEATPFVNPNSANVPSGPVTSLTSMSTGGFGSTLHYLTTSGVLVMNNQIQTPYCQ